MAPQGRGARRAGRAVLAAGALAAAAIVPAGTGAAGEAPAAAHAAPRAAEAPAVHHLRGPRHVERYGRFQTRARITPEAANPFDPAEIDVQGVFVDPRGREHRAIGFWFQRYERALVGGVEQLTPAGRPGWRVRFAPDRVGRWTWWWEARTPAGETRTPPQRVHVLPSDDPGFLRRSAVDPRYLAHDDGSPWFAVGENVGWYDARGTFAYDEWYARLAEQGANFARLWMPSWAFGIEWSDTGLGDYRDRLDRAWQLDHVVERGRRLGIYQMLALQNHGAFSTAFNSEWAGNPYNAANGGPLASPGEFFTDATARDLFRRRLRYIVARWGYSTHVMAWELWNEVDLTDGYDSATQVAWHREMADALRSYDPHDHLVSTSFAIFVRDPAVWSGAGLDFSQLHFYSRSVVELFPDLAQNVVDWTRTRVAETGLPTLFAELGVDANGPAETRAADPEGIGIHDGLWAGVVSGGFGTAMTWWWDNLVDLEPDRYYPMFGAVARFVDGVAWDREGFGPAGASVDADGRAVTPWGLQGARTVLLWLDDRASSWKQPVAVEIDGATLTLDALARGRWCGSWYDPWAGEPAGPVRLRARGSGAETLAVPAFTRDLALRLERCGGRR